MLHLRPATGQQWRLLASMTGLSAWALVHVMRGPLPFGGPDPLNQRWTNAMLLVLLVLSVAFQLLSLDRWPGGLEFSLDGEFLRFRELQRSLYRRMPRVLAETSVRPSDLRHLESQHGVILKGTSFHRDLILPKGQAIELIAWLQEQGVQRFSLAEASA